MTLDEAIAVFDKSADRTRPNAQTEAWAVIRAELANPDRLQVTNMLVLCGEREVRDVDGLPQKLRALIDGLITQRQRADAAESALRALQARVGAAEVVAWQLRVKKTGFVRGTYADEPTPNQLEFSELDGEEYVELIERVRLLAVPERSE